MKLYKYELWEDGTVEEIEVRGVIEKWNAYRYRDSFVVAHMNEIGIVSDSTQPYLWLKEKNLELAKEKFVEYLHMKNIRERIRIYEARLEIQDNNKKILALGGKEQVDES